MNKETIEPCPFCGCRGIIQDGEWIGDNYLSGHYVECINVTCPIEPRTNASGLTVDQAIQIWNTRADKQEGE